VPRVVLISTYDLGRPPFGLASPAAWLEREGVEVVCNDLAVDPLDEAAIACADLVAFHLPMHTATRRALPALERVRALRPGVPVAFYGLYAAMNEPLLRSLGAVAVLGGEFEHNLVRLVSALPPGATPGSGSGGPAAAGDALPVISHERLAFIAPRRAGLPPLERYARLVIDGEERLAGATEASRGCRHRCRHCPVVPVYDGRFRIVPRDVVLEDVRRQVDAGARHITFGDPDFWNGIGHALPLVREFHRRFPRVTYDATIKIEHLLAHARHLPVLRETGCAFVTSAVEAVDDAVLERLDKGHTRAGFVTAVALCRDAGLTLHPTFVAFTPWITAGGYRDLLDTIAELDLVEHVAPVQLTLRLLIPAGSRLLDLPEVRALVGSFDPVALVHPWRHPLPGVDRLQADVQVRVTEAVCRNENRRTIFGHVLDVVERRRGSRPRGLDPAAFASPRAPVPYLTEPWYC
jgi:radical SAM superfamily enzyme YgiQ (UPF0313 family)